MSFKKAGKQIDKFSQWTGEKLFKEEKTQHSRAFQDLETEIELKRKAVERLSQTSTAYLKSISKREKMESSEIQSDNSKVLLIEHVGLTMVHFGTELGLRSSYGQRLVEIGRAQCKIAAAQEKYAEELADGFLSGLERSTEEMKDYSAARKKLESRRLTMDAAQKRQATSKKSSPAIDEEVRVAKARFEETQEDVEMRMEEISQNEGIYLEDLKNFVQAQSAYFTQQKEILAELQNSLGSMPLATSSPHRSSPAPKKMSNSAARAAMFAEPVFASGSEISANRSRSNSTKSQTDMEKKSLFGSLRKKSIGSGSNGSNGLSVPGHIPGGRKSWGQLNDEDDDEEVEKKGAADVRRSTSVSSRPSIGGRRLTTSSVAEAGAGWGKIVRATFEFKGAERDELTLRVGDVITVIEEVSEDWWKGTLSSGKSGLFPSAYTQPLPLIRKTVPPAPALPSTHRPGSGGRSFTQPVLSPASSRFSPPPVRTGLDVRSTRDERSSFQYSDEDDGHSHQQHRPKHRSYGSHSSTAQRGGYSDSDPESGLEDNTGKSRNGRGDDRDRRSRSADRSDLDDEEEIYHDKAGLTNPSTSPYRQPLSGVTLGLGRLSVKKPVPPPPPSLRRGTVSGSTARWSPGGGSTERNGSKGKTPEDEENPFFDPN